jgi:Predicted glycosyl hydrolase
MIIHVVQKDETIRSIADMYNMNTERLIQENGLTNPFDLAVGQTIVIVHAKQTHTVQEGDSLQKIANQYGITLIELLRNNPYLIDRENIFPGESLVIQYEDEKIEKITTNGYVFHYVDLNILKKNLLFLTYLSIYSYFVSENGDLNDIDDQDVINLAKSYGVAPIMVITNQNDAGFNNEIAHNLIESQVVRNNFINNILTKIKSKGYHAININFPYIRTVDSKGFTEFISELTEKLHEENCKVILTLTPSTFEQEAGANQNTIDYTMLGETVDGFVLSYYDWAYPTDRSTQMIPFYYIKKLVEYYVTRLPSDKIMFEVATLGYIWDIPYEEDVTKVNIISFTNAMSLAGEINATIQFNKLNLSSYFYITNKSLRQVLFFDARGLDSYVHLAPDYSLQGIAIWNVMYYLSQQFFLINTQYDIETLYSSD